MTQPKHPPISLRLAPELLAEIEKWAEDQGLTRNAAIARLCALGLAAPPVEPRERLTIVSKAPKPKSAVHVSAPLAGTFERPIYQKTGKGKRSS